MEPAGRIAVHAAALGSWGRDVETGRANTPQRHASQRGRETFGAPAHLHRTPACIFQGYNVRSGIIGGHERHPAGALSAAFSVATKNCQRQVALACSGRGLQRAEGPMVKGADKKLAPACRPKASRSKKAWKIPHLEREQPFGSGGGSTSRRTRSAAVRLGRQCHHKSTRSVWFMTLEGTTAHAAAFPPWCGVWEGFWAWTK